jgi:hypothetical protein
MALHSVLAERKSAGDPWGVEAGCDQPKDLSSRPVSHGEAQGFRFCRLRAACYLHAVHIDNAPL